MLCFVQLQAEGAEQKTLGRRWPQGPELSSADPGLFEAIQHTGRPLELWTRVYVHRQASFLTPGVLFKK